MELSENRPYRAAFVVWQPRPGVYALTVVCKAAFELAPGEARPATSGHDVVPADVLRDGDEGKSLIRPADLVPFKKRPEVLVVGHAHAPFGRPVPGLVARLAVRGVDKVIAVHGDRFWSASGALSAPVPFERMPLLWARAAGGPGTANPVGARMGEGAVPDAWGRVVVPNLLPPGVVVARRQDIFPPVGFGPIAPSWPGRAQRLPLRPGAWEPSRWASQPMPEALDTAYFNAAPPDQELDELSGDESLRLEHLHPHFPELRTRLPGTRPRATVDLGSGRSEVRLRCDTLWIDADQGLCVLTYRGHVMLDHPQQRGRIEVGADEAAGPESGRLRATPAFTVLAPNERREPALPFAAAAVPRDAEAAQAGVSAERQARASERVAALGDFFGIPSSRPVAVSVTPDVPPPPIPGEGGPDRRGMTVLAPAEPRAPAALPFKVTPGIDDFSAVRCGDLAARLLLSPATAGEILRREDLTREQWDDLHERRLALIEAELRRGKATDLAAYDAACVAAIERERGPIELSAYAAIAVAAEHGEEAAALTARGLPEEAWPHLQRVWIGRRASDPAMGKAVLRAMAAARGA